MLTVTKVTNGRRHLCRRGGAAIGGRIVGDPGGWALKGCGPFRAHLCTTTQKGQNSETRSSHLWVDPRAAPFLRATYSKEA